LVMKRPPILVSGKQVSRQGTRQVTIEQFQRVSWHRMKRKIFNE
jgi:hypothetical protein